MRTSNLGKLECTPKRTSAGVVMVEYAFLLVFFGIPVMVGTMALGIHMIKGYGNVRNDMVHVGP